MTCPLSRWREAHGLSVRGLAQAAGCTAATIWAAEAGAPLTLPGRVRTLVTEVDGAEAAAELARQYREWRRERGMALLREAAAL